MIYIYIFAIENYETKFCHRNGKKNSREKRKKTFKLLLKKQLVHLVLN